MLPGGLTRSAISVDIDHQYASFLVAGDFSGQRRLTGIFEFFGSLLRNCRPVFYWYRLFLPISAEVGLSWAACFFLISPFLWPFGLSVLFERLAFSSLFIGVVMYASVRVEGKFLEFYGGEGGDLPFRVVKSNRRYNSPSLNSQFIYLNYYNYAIIRLDNTFQITFMYMYEYLCNLQVESTEWQYHDKYFQDLKL